MALQISYRELTKCVEAGDLARFSEGWAEAPAAEERLEILAGSDHVVLAVNEESGKVVGFVTAISDGILSAYISLLEVLPDNRRQGIGTELMRRMLQRLEGLYMVDVLCDPELVPFYERFGMKPATAMILRGRRR